MDEPYISWAKLSKVKSDLDKISFRIAKHREQCNRTDHLTEITEIIKSMKREIDK